MRVMQLIDSLELGGAERMAVTYANMLSKEITASYLCVTRAEGALKSSLFSAVNYYFIGKKRTLDTKAVGRLVQLIKKENIDIIHAHGTSFFFAYLVKLKCKKIKLVWHNHHGASSQYGWIKMFVLKKCIESFNVVITVNQELNGWVVSALKFPQKSSYYISNFIDFNILDKTKIKTLKGKESQRIVCLANLKYPKEHLFLSKAFLKITEAFPEATLHFVGADYNDEYSEVIKEFISENKLQNTIFIHGKQSNPQQYLNACAIGVIASSSEGLPMALLEYAKSNLAVITTNVGQCATVVKDHGVVVSSGDVEEMSNAIKRLLQNIKEKSTLAKEYSNHIKFSYSLEAIKQDILKIYDVIHYG